MRNITFRNIWYSWKYVQKLNENEDIQKNWVGKISSGSWQRLPARTLPHPRRANFVHVWNLRNIFMLKLLFFCIVDHITDYVLRLLFANLPLHLHGLFCALASQHRLDLLLSVPKRKCMDKTMSLIFLFIYSEFQTVIRKNGNSSWLAIRRRTPLPPLSNSTFSSFFYPIFFFFN